LDKEEVPQTQLSKAGRLGWTTWLKTKPFEDHADNLVLAASN
jgi:predicted component of type VI protein secretion system